MRRSLSLFAAVLFFAACGDEPRVPGGNNNGNKDAGAGDTGNNQNNDAGNNGMDGGMNTPDTGMNTGMDGGMMPDSGLACNPEDGSGCSGGNACFFVASTNMSQCRVPANPPKMFEEACSQQLHDCAPGYTCVALQGEAGPTCKKVCMNGNSADCAGLQGASMNYACPGEFPNSGGVGVCQGAGASCVPYNDMCPAMQYCDFVDQTTTGCQPEGSTQLNATCNGAGQCMRGGICINIGTGGKCYEPCDPNTGMCAAGPLCLGLQGINFGICAPACDPFNIMCAQNETCQFVASPAATGCVPSSNAQAGSPCTNGTCARGAMCVNNVCRLPCDMAHPCAAGMCNMIQGGMIGVCI